LLKLEYEIIELRTRHDFNIARAAAPPQRRNVWVRLHRDGVEGWGEAAPNAFYAEDADTVVGALEVYRAIIERAAPRADIENDLIAALASRHPQYPPHPSARCAVSAAMLDLLAREAGQPVWQYLGLVDQAPPSSFTIGIDDLEVMREKAREASTYSILKIKVGTGRDEDILKMLREEVPAARVRVDANTAWTADQTIALLPMMRDYGIELIEQPVAADDYDGLARVTSVSDIPIIADESCRISEDVEKLAGKVHGVNIKFAKCGSVLEALRIVKAARLHGMQLMLGCMIESTLGIASAIQIASLMDYVDLDGAALLANDPFGGPHIDETGALHFNREPGLGVSRA
jgi:L-Ala-D/L-Glu epimerase